MKCIHLVESVACKFYVVDNERKIYIDLASPHTLWLRLFWKKNAEKRYRNLENPTDSVSATNGTFNINKGKNRW